MDELQYQMNVVRSLRDKGYISEAECLRLLITLSLEQY